ncbi:MAG: beta-galactosidase trimerization domain-containing protein [Clostridia bacterium]|nr:beta-galactosidase trimerization domain-containing protein [Clostridia bacterium]
MNKNYKGILSVYEDFKLHSGALSHEEGFFDYQAPSSIHSDVTCFAYGIREVRSCVSVNKSAAVSSVTIDKKDIKRRFYLKLRACLFDWEKYVCGIKININGNTAYENGSEFFENVNLGWPTVYIPVDNSLLAAGENIIEISQTSGDTALLVSSLDLISLPEMKPRSQIGVKTAARIGDEFAISFYTPGAGVSGWKTKQCAVVEVLKSPINDNHTVVRIRVEGKKPELTLKIGDTDVRAVMPEVYPASDDFCMVGTDSDDHRHDDSDETDRIIEIFANTGFGNFWQARPQHYRNFYTLSDETSWKKRIDYLRAFGTKISLTDSEDVMPYLPEMCGDAFVGKHFHEAYLFFCAALEADEKWKKEMYLDSAALKASESFGESKKMFCEALKKMYLGCKKNTGLTSVGSPSLLTSYEASSGFERVTIEPVSNVNILIGAVRGAAPRMWGAHVPTDWYFGEPNDLTKAKKFLLAMKLLYINGADYIYAENSLFKTNAFSREDWEDEFCTTCRTYLREFYEYTVKNPREGKLKTDLAVIYGNNEYFMWHYDDRMAELPENDDWDITLWGKWKDNRHHKCFRAIDAWLPLSDNQNSKKNIINLNLFSGSHYGSVDVVPYEKDYSEYRAAVMLGWNTYEDGFAKKIYGYAAKGGTAFLSYCHFNRTDRCDMPMEYANDEIEKYFGIKCKEVTEYSGKAYFGDETAEISSVISVLQCDAEGAEKVAEDENGNALVLKLRIGEGEIYFGTFADYNCPDGKLFLLQYILRLIGDSKADVICTNKNISFTHRVKSDGVNVINALNMCPDGVTPEKYTLKLKNGKSISGQLMPCEIKEHVLKI